MKVWKRCLAAVLSFVIFTTSVNISEAAGTYDSENFIWTANDAEVVAEYYGLDTKAAEVLKNKAIDRGYSYILYAPYDNGTKRKKDLIAVDYLDKKVYAKALHTGGCSWLPIEAVLSVEGEEVETITLTTGTCYYDDIEYSASEAFIYDGNSYTVAVKYQLHVDISMEEQTRLLQIPMILTQTAVNLEKNLMGVRLNAKKLSDMIPYLEQLLTLEFTREEVVVPETEEESSEEFVTVIVTEPAFDPAEHAEEIAAIQALYQEYTENEGLILYNMSEDYRTISGHNILTYTFENGAQILEKSTELYNHVLTLKNSTRLKSVWRELSTVDTDLYQELKYLQTTLKDLIGTALKPGKLTELQDAENWKLLNEEVKAQIFKEEYSEKDFAQLEDMVYALRNSEPAMPVIESETILAAQMDVRCEITTYDIHVILRGFAAAGEADNHYRVTMEPAETTITLLEGATQKEIQTRIEETGLEKNTLAGWNRLNADYQINTANYDRQETELSGDLSGDITDYEIVYEPKVYKVKSNFIAGTTFDFGSRVTFPVSGNEDLSYEYVVEREDGVKQSYDEGSVYRITGNAVITQTVGSEKTEYRLYDFLIDDTQYRMTDDEKSILAHSAVFSPTLKIRVPEKSIVGEILYEEGTYSVQASTFNAGMGMAWEPQLALVMKGNQVVSTATFINGTAYWGECEFTHVNVSYCLKIDKVKGNLGFNRSLEESEVLYALNLPHNLVTQTAAANKAFCGEGDVSVKSVYEDLDTLMYKLENGPISMTLDKALGLISNILEGEEAIDAVRTLLASEKNGGAWNFAADELALYSYMKLCAEADWSLAVYFKEGYYDEISSQTALVATCMTKITEDSGFKQDDIIPENYKQMLQDIIPQLNALAAKIKGPHEALNVKDAEFPALIKYLLSLEGTTSSVNASNGIYAYSTLRRNGENAGSVTVNVNVTSKRPMSRDISYELEVQDETGKYHILTEEESGRIQNYIAEMEASMGLTESEKQYYDLTVTDIPKAGDMVSRNTTVALNYSAKEYTVTISGVDSSEYCASFKYKGEYAIYLPPYSQDPEFEDVYYLYTINGEVIKSNNGLGGYYTFTKEDLTTLFINQNYVISRTEVEKDNIKVDMILDPNEENIRSYRLDWSNRVLYVEADPEGLKVNAFEDAITYVGGANTIEAAYVINENREPALNDTLSNGSRIDMTIIDANGELHEESCDIVLMGDVNKNGLVDAEDRQYVVDVYFGHKQYGDKMEAYAADMNSNGYQCDSNDIWRLFRKYTYWDETSDKRYEPTF